MGKKPKKQWKPKPYTKLLDKHYPIGWGTGLDEAEWRAFAEQYKTNGKGN